MWTLRTTSVPPIRPSRPSRRSSRSSSRRPRKREPSISPPNPDREGEAICQHLAEELANGKPIYRVLFNEITKDSIRKAFEHPGEINGKLVEAQQARRILDRLVGYKISPLLWDKVRRGLSAGRVQTVALRLIVEREREINAFEKEEYWTIAAHLNAQVPPSFDARLMRLQGQEVILRGEGGFKSIEAQAARGKFRIASEADAKALQGRLEGQSFVVASTATREEQRNPAPPFITSTLQQEASRKLYLSVKRSMGLAQRLYEGVECGEEGLVGLITYMRTDSTRVSDVALTEARELIAANYGDRYLPGSPNIYRSKKGAQDAHEAIRPTSSLRTPDRMAKYLNEDELKLYRLIWQRFVASQMAPARFDRTTIEIKAGAFDLRATGLVQKFDGFLKLYQEGRDQVEDDDEREGRLPAVQAGEELRLVAVKPVQHVTEPPPRFNEASLVKELEKRGIGRPSTYAAILNVIQQREYVEKLKGRFFPSELGTIVTELLVKNFADIFDIAYTARMEDALDEIEDGNRAWVATLGDFYAKFDKDLKLAATNMADIKRMEEPTDISCEKCGKPMVIKWGKHGKFLACTGYPECTNTRDLAKDPGDPAAAEAPAPEREEICENCGRSMVLKRGRFGQFLACTGYPDCKTTRKIGQAEKKPPVPTDEPCPQCGNPLVIREGRYGEFTSCGTYPKCKYTKQNSTGVECPECKKGQIVEKRSRRGTFYSCDRYPKCKYSLRNKPVARQCPQCGSAYLLEKTTKTGSTFECPNDSCNYSQAA